MLLKKGHSLYKEIADAAADANGVAKIRILWYTVWCISEQSLLRSLLVDSKSNLRKGPVVNILRRIFGKSIFTAESPEWDQLSRSSKNTLGSVNSQKYNERTFMIVKDWINNLERMNDKEIIVNMREGFYYLSMDITSAILLGGLLPEKIKKEIGADQEWIRSTINKRIGSSIILPEWLPTVNAFKINRKQQHINAQLKPWIDNGRTKSNQYGKCLLSDLDLEILDKSMCPFSQTNHTDFVKTLFFTGIRTTAITLEWIILYLLSYPKYLHQIQKEIDTNIDKLDAIPYSTKKLVCLRRFINEVMRIAPIAHTQVRQVKSDFEFNNHIFCKGDILLLSVYGLNNNPEIWVNPRGFNPERFGNDMLDPVLIPYGLGKHTCPGQYLANQSINTILISLIKRFNMDAVEKIQLEMKSAVLLEPKHSQSIKLKAR